MTMSSPASTHLLRPAPAAPLLPRRASVQLSRVAGGAAPRSRRRSGRLAVVRAATAEVAEAAGAPAYTTESLILYFKAEGTMEERAVPKITQALEGMDGVTDLEVLIEEGIGSVVPHCTMRSVLCKHKKRLPYKQREHYRQILTKATTVQATGVASNLVEAIQGVGFKLQTLSLSFEDFDKADAAAAVTGEGADVQASE
ncbi:hypothetical protein CFC21_002693 [Triticum aestivum]|uniref:Uncharacterized protein n=2 Tax=Triticum TaxID=4564 RepID=A0A9R0Q9H4_TRITD|nr:uncharacterized protein LOC123055942 isoform X1 [Triticum aestivum]KAF6984732.1 hypothetical protein CFC21_002693 [Triticum aestivum]VAH07461.1 unnamed protein product [Triticum turgidum subsp. durum]